MGTTLSTLSNLAIYIGLVVVGAFLGSRKALRSRPLAWVGKLQFAALMILIVTLGINLGANDEVVSSLGQIGLAALVITVLAMAGSLLCLTLLRRFVLKLDHYGLPRGSEAAREEEAHHGGKADNSLTFLIVIAVVLGMLAGRVVLPAAGPAPAPGTAGATRPSAWLKAKTMDRAPTPRRPSFARAVCPPLPACFISASSFPCSWRRPGGPGAAPVI